MPFQLSPGVGVSEKDLTSIIPAVSTSVGAFAGKFAWGPVERPTRVAGEDELVSRFSRPGDESAASFFTAANYLAYSNNMLVARADSENASNAVSNPSASVKSLTLVTPGMYHGAVTATVSAPDVTGGTTATASVKLQGAGIAAITVTQPGTAYTSAPTVMFTSAVGDTGFGAAATAALSGAPITAVNINSGGSGYANPVVTIGAPTVVGGIQATATAQLDGAGVVIAINIDNAGSGYLTPPVVTIAGSAGSGASLTATIGLSGVGVITVTNPGSGYAIAPTIQLIGGGGTNAAATATVTDSPITSVTLTAAGSGYSTVPTVSLSGAGAGGGAVTATLNQLAGVKIKNPDDYQDNFSHSEATVGQWAAKYPGDLGNSIGVSIADSASFDAWAYKNQFGGAPGTSSFAAAHNSSNDEVHVVVFDASGAWTGVAGTILERYAFLSKASDAKSFDGTTSYYKNVINGQSQYVWFMNFPAGTTDWGVPSTGVTFSSLSVASTSTLSGGITDWNSTQADLEAAWGIFSDDTLYDISLVPVGDADSQLTEFVRSNVVEQRLDCMYFVSTQDPTSGGPIRDSNTSAADDMVTFRQQLTASSYGALDSGYKYQYDRYNDTYRWIPLNGDIAGLCARTDLTDDPWFSPGGYNRGVLKNVIKLALNPRKTIRDVIYPAGINPVISAPGQGIVLYGDKTLQSKASAFDRINVRRLFIVLEKAISTAAKFQLFEFNDAFTQAQFKNMVQPFLRDVMGRRGITDFVVVCDSRNNTPQIIDSNQFVGDIYIKPNRSINFIQLNFIAAGTSVNFNEIGG